MRNENIKTQNENAICDLLYKQIEAIRNKDIESCLASYADDVLSFDVVDPLRFSGKDAIRKRLKEWFSSFEGSVENEFCDLRIEASDNLAFCSRMNHVNAIRIDGSKLDMWWREDRRTHPNVHFIHQLQNHYLDMTKVHLTNEVMA